MQLNHLFNSLENYNNYSQLIGYSSPKRKIRTNQLSSRCSLMFVEDCGTFNITFNDL